MNNDINNQEKNNDDLSDILKAVEDTPTPSQESHKTETIETKEEVIEEVVETEITEDKTLKKEVVEEDVIEKDIQEEPKENKKEKKSKEPKKKSLVGSCIFLVISLIFLGVSAFYFNNFVINANQIPVRKIAASDDEQTVTNVKMVKIYSINKSLTKLVTSDVEVTSEDFSLEAKAIFENIKNKNNFKVKNKDGKTWQFMDPSVTLLNSYVTGDKIYLNISSNLIDSIHTKKQELLVLYSLINTYTSIDGIKHVKILLSNKEVEKLKWYSLKTFYSENHDL